MAQNALWREDFGKKLHFCYKNILLKYSKEHETVTKKIDIDGFTP